MAKIYKDCGVQLINRFQTYVIGANRPVGQFLSRMLASQNLPYTSFSFDNKEKLSINNANKPFLVLLPSLEDKEDLQHISFWIEQAQQQDIPVLLLSSLVIYQASEEAWQEEDRAYSQHPLAQEFLNIEAQVRENRRHLILRAGAVFSLMGKDFANQLFVAMRAKEKLVLDSQTLFNPTPADDVASVILAMLKQANCMDSLWGTYHFNAVEPVASYQFAQALFAEANHYEALGEITVQSSETGEKPSLWIPSSDNTKLFHSFGIKPKAWRKGLSRLVKRYYQVED